MCDPMTVGIAAAGLQAAGQLSSAMATSASNKANAQIMRTNAQIKDKAAEDSIQRGADEGANARLRARQATAQLRANRASSGTIVDTGTALDLQEQNAGTGALNSLIIQNNAEREAYGYKVGAVSDRQQADVLKMNARSAMVTGLLTAGGTLVTGAANNGGVFNNAGKSGTGLPWQQPGYKNPQGGFYY